MSTSRPDAVPSPSLPDLSCLAAQERSTLHVIQGTPFLIRTVRTQDLAPLSDVLASSFHAQEGWMRWFYPLLKVGIYEDLKSRLQTRRAHYACLAAVKPNPPNPKGRLATQFVGQSSHAALGIVTERDESILGTIEIALKSPSFLQPLGRKYLYLSNLAVKADCRRQGIAQQLLQTCDRIASDWGFHDLYLHVLENNYSARQLYTKAGYKLKRIDTNPFSLMLGQPRQIFLHKRLR